jgi:hypothetical protein
VEWSGVEWSGVEWSGVEWSGVEWSGVEWSGVGGKGRGFWCCSENALTCCRRFSCRQNYLNASNLLCAPGTTAANATDYCDTLQKAVKISPDNAKRYALVYHLFGLLWTNQFIEVWRCSHGPRHHPGHHPIAVLVTVLVTVRATVFVTVLVTILVTIACISTWSVI